MNDLVNFIAQGIVAHPDQVKVNIISGETVMIVELTVHEDDVPRIIGPEGKVLQAMRQVLSASSGRKKAVLELVNTHAGWQSNEE